MNYYHLNMHTYLSDEIYGSGHDIKNKRPKSLIFKIKNTKATQ